MITYPIHERFSTFQGEGEHMGRAAFFIRTFGCPVHCPWCDSAGTWHPDWAEPAFVEKMSAESIAVEVLESGAPIAVITGGEPTVFDLLPLTSALHEQGLRVHLETSGGFFIKGHFDWITLSPKKWKYPLQVNVALADEFKIIVEAKEDIEFYSELLENRGGCLTSGGDIKSIWLHPEWSKREDPVVLGAIADAVKGSPRFRAGWQLHKLYRVDSRDSRTRELVPLGGDLTKGY